MQLSHEMVLPQSRSLLARQRHAGARLDIFIEVLQSLLSEEADRGLSPGLRPWQVRLWLFHRNLFLNCVHLSFWLQLHLVCSYVLGLQLSTPHIDRHRFPSLLMGEGLAEIVLIVSLALRLQGEGVSF